MTFSGGNHPIYFLMENNAMLVDFRPSGVILVRFRAFRWNFGRFSDFQMKIGRFWLSGEILVGFRTCRWNFGRFSDIRIKTTTVKIWVIAIKGTVHKCVRRTGWKPGLIRYRRNPSKNTPPFTRTPLIFQYGSESWKSCKNTHPSPSKKFFPEKIRIFEGKFRILNQKSDGFLWKYR